MRGWEGQSSHCIWGGAWAEAHESGSRADHLHIGDEGQHLPLSAAGAEQDVDRGTPTEVRGTVGGRPFHAVGQAAILPAGEPVEADGSSGAVPAEQLEPLAVCGMNVGVGVKGEALQKGAAPLARRTLWRRTPPTPRPRTLGT